MSRGVKICEEEYERTFYRWYYTPRWRLFARFARRLEWKLWLHGMSAEIKKEVA